MNFFDNADNAKFYMDMIKDDLNKTLVNHAIKYFDKTMKVLELGSAAGHDLKILDEYVEVVGSDNAEPFIRHLKDTFYDLRILRLDAVTMDTHKKFDGIYSNKVLHHLEKADLKTSLENQAKVLNSKGVMVHGFWQNIDALDTPDGLLFNTYNQQSIQEYIPDTLEIVHFEPYKEYEYEDSFFIVLRKKD